MEPAQLAAVDALNDARVVALRAALAVAGAADNAEAAAALAAARDDVFRAFRAADEALALAFNALPADA